MSSRARFSRSLRQLPGALLTVVVVTLAPAIARAQPLLDQFTARCVGSVSPCIRDDVFLATLDGKLPMTGARLREGHAPARAGWRASIRPADAPVDTSRCHAAETAPLAASVVSMPSALGVLLIAAAVATRRVVRRRVTA